jgi:hypothetical protein
MTVSPLLVPPGRSPFHVRGTTYLRVREWVNDRVPGGLPAVLEHIADRELREFISQVFLPVRDYDALPLRPFTEAVALVEGRPWAESVRNRARAVAESDINGLYKLLLRAVSPATAVERLQRISQRYFDFGSASVRALGDRRAEGSQTGMPRPLAGWFMPMLEGYGATLLEMTGARAPRLRFSSPERDGEREGIETVTLRFEVSWT